ncbi:MAG TPA: peptidylprolyl isomerase [Burkholderiales bacterium]|nr:peptidylprolyl isomerase [Burkholderiales bacterium]
MHQRAWPNWMREPLVHFLVIGALLFTIDYFIAGRDDDPRTINVDAAVDNQARQVFSQARGREPNEEETYALRRVWLDNEVLYREGLALGVDKGDTAIRERVIFKMLRVVNADLKLPPIDDKGLRVWFEQNRARYDEPARYDFQEAVLAGDRSEATVRAFVETLHKGMPGELQAGLRVFKGRPYPTLVQAYGQEFATALAESSPRKWSALPTREGWRAVHLESISPPKRAEFDPLRGVVLQDWSDAMMAEQRTDAVRALTRKYTVTVDEVEK